MCIGVKNKTNEMAFLHGFVMVGSTPFTRSSPLKAL
jgi:hypothetical protein